LRILLHLRDLALRRCHVACRHCHQRIPSGPVHEMMRLIHRLERWQRQRRLIGDMIVPAPEAAMMMARQAARQQIPPPHGCDPPKPCHKRRNIVLS
jgi:hypothetical protein